MYTGREGAGDPDLQGRVLSPDPTSETSPRRPHFETLISWLDFQSD